jgi:hypothetical protein
VSKLNGHLRRSFPRIATAALAAGALLAGCGSSGDSATSATSEPLSKQQFVKQANAICEKRLQEKDATVQNTLRRLATADRKSAERQLEEVITEDALPGYQKIIDEIDALTPPPKDVATVDGFLAKAKAAQREAEENPAALLASNPFMDATKAAQKYGLDSCLL